MKFLPDHDYHIHSRLSNCSGDPEQTPERILRYAEEYGLREICITDHFWDETVPGASSWYGNQNYPHIKESLPLPQSDSVKFHFGCETEMDKFFTVGISKSVMDELEFVIVPTTHLHMMDFTINEEDDTIERRAELYVQRFEELLKKPYPAKKVGIAHLTCSLIARKGEYVQVLDLIPDEAFETCFRKTAQKGFGVELNLSPLSGSIQEQESVLRPYRIAKQCGCKFYLGSDAHHPEKLDEAMERFTTVIDLLDLKESDKFRPFD